MSTSDRPTCCIICGYYLTTDEKCTGARCVDPGHWQAAGLLRPRDYYAMARLVAGARAELARRPDYRCERSVHGWEWPLPARSPGSSA